MPVTSLDIARSYIKRGWNPIPIPHRSKRPADKGWQERIIDEASAPQYFNGRDQNIGIMLGPTSKGLTDVDLDCLEAVLAAPHLLPETNTVFGRPSKRSSHYLYRTDLAKTLGKAGAELSSSRRRGCIGSALNSRRPSLG